MKLDTNAQECQRRLSSEKWDATRNPPSLDGHIQIQAAALLRYAVDCSFFYLDSLAVFLR